LKTEGGYSRIFCPNRKFRRTERSRSVWCSFCVEKDIFHEW